MRYLTFALTKGRLANKTMEMFERAGITCEAVSYTHLRAHETG